MLYNKESIDRVIAAFKKGDIVIVTDDDSRENEGDLIVAAEFCTTEKMAFIIRYTSGIICTPMPLYWANKLSLPPMVENNSSAYHTAFTVSVDYKEGTTTGISAYERALTARKLSDNSTKSEEFVRPGHIFPLTARNGGLLERSGHTEAAVDLCKLAGLSPVAVIGELMNDDGTVQHGQQIDAFAAKYNILKVTIEDLITYRQVTEKLVHEITVSEYVINGVNTSHYRYDIGKRGVIYNVLKIGSVNFNDAYIYIGNSEPTVGDIDLLLKKYGAVIYIWAAISNECDRGAFGSDNERHTQALQRSEIWCNYMAIAQILKDLSICCGNIVSDHSESVMDLYKNIFLLYYISIRSHNHND